MHPDAPRPTPPVTRYPSGLPPRPAAGRLPPRPPARGWWVLIGAVLAVCTLVCCGGAALGVGYYGWTRATTTPTEAAGEAASALRGAPAVAVSAWATDTAGRSVRGTFTVTADRSASGSVADPGEGAAQYVATGGKEAVRADTAWWGHRAPRAADGGRDRWIRPERGLAFPVDVAATFGPRALAGTIDALLANARETDTEAETTLGGRRVRTLVSGDWTLYASADGPPRIVRMAGPLRPGGPIRPALASGRAQVVPAVGSRLDGPDYQPVDGAVEPPYIAIEPKAAGPAAARTVQAAIAKVVEPPATAAPSAPGAPSAPRAPRTGPSALDGTPPQESAQPLPAAFTTRVLTSFCSTPVCSWSVVVTNTGGSPGSGTVYASVTPGMGVTPKPFGPLAPGQSATFPYTFPNPAPQIPGRTTRVQVSYEAWTYSGSLDGPDPKVPQRLLARGIDPRSIQELQQLGGAYRPVGQKFLDLTTAKVPPDSTQERFNERAVAAMTSMIKNGLLPEVRAILESGRLADPAVLVDKLNQIKSNPYPYAYPSTEPDQNGIGVRREIEQLAAELRTGAGTVH